VLQRRRFPSISGDAAIAALKWLVARQKIKAKDVTAALKQRERLVEEIRERLEALGSDGLRLLGPRAVSGRARGQRRRKKPISKARQAAWRAQGRYLAAVRRLPKASRLQVRTIREKKGMKAALAAAKKLRRA
jgi:hypothetical protein